MRWVAVPLAFVSQLTAGVAYAQQCQAFDEYDEIASVVTDQFYDKTFNGLDWDARVARYRNQLACEDGPEQVSDLVNALLSELEASHTAIYTKADLDYWGLNSLFHFADLDAYEINFPGIWPERTGGKWYARFVLEGSVADQAGVRQGDELVALDGARFTPLGFGEGVSTLTVAGSEGDSRQVRLLAPEQSIMRAFIEASRASSRTFAVGDKNVGYFHLWAARDLILEAMNEALSAFDAMQIDALILDYRGGYGGTSEDYLVQIRESEHLREIPKYFLIDDSVRSGKELLAGIIKRDQLGTLVGSTTAGYYLGGRVNRLFDNEYFLYVAIGGGSAPGIGRIEGVGIEPDVRVAPCIAHCDGADPQFDRVIDLING